MARLLERILNKMNVTDEDDFDDFDEIETIKPTRDKTRKSTAFSEQDTTEEEPTSIRKTTPKQVASPTKNVRTQRV